MGDHQVCASWLWRSGVNVREGVPRASECHEDSDWGSEECEEEKISSAEGGLELVKFEELGWF